MYKIPYRSEQEIEEAVKKFLQDFRIETPPVNIELIAEKLGLRIVPIFSKVRELKGYLSVKLSEIGINGRFFEESYNNIYRFTIAHEIAHYVLHKDFYSEFRGTSCDEWCEFYKKHNCVIDRSDIQADIFASFVLLPTNMIEKDIIYYSKAFSEYEEDIKQEKVEYGISQKYQVSLKTAQIRLRKLNRAMRLINY